MVRFAGIALHGKSDSYLQARLDRYGMYGRREGRSMTDPQQLGFGFEEILREQETAHIPGTMEEGIPYFRKLIERHNEAMMAGDEEKTMAIRAEAHELACKLNGG